MNTKDILYWKCVRLAVPFLSEISTNALPRPLSEVLKIWVEFTWEVKIQFLLQWRKISIKKMQLICRAHLFRKWLYSHFSLNNSISSQFLHISSYLALWYYFLPLHSWTTGKIWQSLSMLHCNTTRDMIFWARNAKQKIKIYICCCDWGKR